MIKRHNSKQWLLRDARPRDSTVDSVHIKRNCSIFCHASHSAVFETGAVGLALVARPAHRAISWTQRVHPIVARAGIQCGCRVGGKPNKHVPRKLRRGATDNLHSEVGRGLCAGHILRASLVVDVPLGAASHAVQIRRQVNVMRVHRPRIPAQHLPHKRRWTARDLYASAHMFSEL